MASFKLFFVVLALFAAMAFGAVVTPKKANDDVNLQVTDRKKGGFFYGFPGFGYGPYYGGFGGYPGYRGYYY